MCCDSNRGYTSSLGHEMDDLSGTRLSGGICAGMSDGATIDDDCNNTGYALVINGHSLVYALQPKLEKLFLDVGTQC